MAQWAGIVIIGIIFTVAMYDHYSYNRKDEK